MKTKIIQNANRLLCANCKCFIIICAANSSFVVVSHANYVHCVCACVCVCVVTTTTAKCLAENGNVSNNVGERWQKDGVERRGQ